MTMPEPATAAPMKSSWTRSEERPRVEPGALRQIGAFAYLAAHLGGLAAGTGPLNVFMTIGRHRSLFWRWLCFASGLLLGGKLPRADTEIIILRVAALCRCRYQWRHHVRLGRKAGLGYRQMAQLRKREISPWATPRVAALLRATDELHEHRTISDPTWLTLRAQLDEREIIELCMLVGHYEMLAMTLNALKVQNDAPCS
jgi:AhpD family alkylhydroperoxidase